MEFEVDIVNRSPKPVKIALNGTVREWMNLIPPDDILKSPEISWKLGEDMGLTLKSGRVTLGPGETKSITISTKVNGKLAFWNPKTPNLYTVILNINDNKQTYDCKTERFGWRQLLIKGKDFYLNGERIQCFGDIQHPFGAYICSRRFAWAWYKMIKDFGGNAVRPHAQPWPRLYYDLADEMGMMVLDEAALFGSSLSLNFGEQITWDRTAAHIKNLIERDKNHPSVIGWSAGNELFAIRLYNKPAQDVADIWDEKIIELARLPSLLDPTRVFITDDGDEDMKGNLPVWSKHFAEGLTLERLPAKVTKPLVIGEQGATYYGRPGQHLYKFAGEKVFESYYGRNEALAIDIYQNAVMMARPLLAYFSPSEVCWFGIEHMNLGYSDYKRLPDSTDGIFAGRPYVEGKPGYQLERIPPYVSTFNPGLDPSLPLYKPLPMFEALKAAMAYDIPQPSPWANACLPVVAPLKPDYPKTVYDATYFGGEPGSGLAKHLERSGLNLTYDRNKKLVMIDGENISGERLEKTKEVIEKVKKEGGLIWILVAEKEPSAELLKLLPSGFELTDRQSTALRCSKDHMFEKYFKLPDLYFSEIRGDNKIMKHGLKGELVNSGTRIMEATNIDWSLFLNAPENRKCAQVVLYEKLVKPEGVALFSFEMQKATVLISSIDYNVSNETTDVFWKGLFAVSGIKTYSSEERKKEIQQGRIHNLMMDGPVEK